MTYFFTLLSNRRFRFDLSLSNSNHSVALELFPAYFLLAVNLTHINQSEACVTLDSHQGKLRLLNNYNTNSSAML